MLKKGGLGGLPPEAEVLQQIESPKSASDGLKNNFLTMERAVLKLKRAPMMKVMKISQPLTIFPNLYLFIYFLNFIFHFVPQPPLP